MVLGAGRDGLTVAYQGVLCLPEFQISRPTGLEPGFGFVAMEAADLQNTLDVISSLPGVDSPAPLSTQDKGSAGSQAPPKGGLNSSGDLVITERLGQGIDWTTTFKGLVITEKGVETIKAVDGGASYVKVELADIRYLWKTRGVVFQWINVPELGSGVLSVPGAPGASVGGTTDSKIPPLVSGSTDDDGKPWTLRRTLEVVVLPRLPGSPNLKRLPPDLEGDKGIPIGHPWDGKLPIKCLGDLLDEFRLVLSLNQDNSVSLWHEGEGQVTREDGTVVNYARGSEDDYVSSSRDIATPHFVPSVVVVLGPPIRDTSRMFLEPVGLIRDPKQPKNENTGQVVPLADALKAMGVTINDARCWPFASPGERALLDFPSEVVKELDRWLFKWFRLPGGLGPHSDHLPIENRGRVDDVGAFLEPRVWSESVLIANGAAAAKLATAGAEKTGTLGESLKGLISAKAANMVAVMNLPWSEQSDGYEIDRTQGIVRFRDYQVVAVDAPPDPAPSGTGTQAAPTPATQPPYANTVGEALLVALGPLGWATLAAAVHDKKILKDRADAAVVAANKAAADALTARKAEGNVTFGGAMYSAIVKRAALVQLEWGWDRKAGATQNVELSHRYASFWTRAASQGGQAAKVTQLQSFDDTSIPLVVHRPELLEVHDADGNTNKDALDSIANKVATAILVQPEVTKGATIHLHRPVPVATNGLVTTTVYQTDGKKPSVTIHVGCFAPMTPPRAETHAREPNYKALRRSVLVPRGLE